MGLTWYEWESDRSRLLFNNPVRSFEFEFELFEAVGNSAKNDEG